MFPYIDIPAIDLGILKLQPFGILVAIGVLLGSWMSRKYVERQNMDEEELRFIGFRLIVIGWIISHLFDVLLYQPERLKDDPLLLLKVWDGISSWGGIVGALLAFLYYTKKRKLSRLRWADACIFGTLGGFLLGRAACAVVHDHIGLRTDFFLAVNFPADRFPGGPAHDLGLYEFFYLLLLTGIAVAIERWWKSRPAGVLVGLLSILYSPVRFGLEFLRRNESDPRYFGFTPAQYVSMVMFAFGIYLVVLAYRRRESILAPARVVSDTTAAEPKKQSKPSTSSKSSSGGGSKKKKGKRKKRK